MAYGALGACAVMRVLVAEDERRVADAVVRGLRREGLAVDLAPDGEQALFKARVTTTTSSCSTATCPSCTATTSAARWPPSSPRRRC